MQDVGNGVIVSEGSPDEGEWLLQRTAAKVARPARRAVSPSLSDSAWAGVPVDFPAGADERYGTHDEGVDRKYEREKEGEAAELRHGVRSSGHPAYSLRVERPG